MFVQLEFYSTCTQVMEVLLQFIPPFAHPYDLLGYTSLSSSQTITTLAFHDSQLISGAKDCHVREYNCCSAKSSDYCTKFCNSTCDYTIIGFSLEHIWPYCIWRYPVIQYCVGSGCLEPLLGYWINHSANDWFKEQRITCTGWKGEYRFGVQTNESFIDHAFLSWCLEW